MFSAPDDDGFDLNLSSFGYLYLCVSPQLPLYFQCVRVESACHHYYLLACSDWSNEWSLFESLMMLVVEFVGRPDLTLRFHVVADVVTEVADFDDFGDFEIAADF